MASIAAAMLVFVSVLGFSESAKSAVTGALLPFFKTGDFFYGGLGKTPKFFSDKAALVEENRVLLEEAEANRVQMADYESIKYENERLREELKLKPLGEFTAVSVLARPPQTPLDSLLVDKGIRDGVENGNFVLAGERVLIGKIAGASNNKSTVVLNSFAGAVSYGYVARTEEPIEIKGDGGGCIKAKVPLDFDIEVGDKIMVGGSAPLLSGVVGMIEEDQSSGFKEVFMSLPVDISKTNILFVERPKNQ